MKYSWLITPLLILCGFSVQQAFSGQCGSRLCSRGKVIKETTSEKPRAFGLLHPNEVKSICQFLDQKDINQFLQSSRQCSADVSSRNISLFTEGRVDTLTLDTPEKLNDFLVCRDGHLYAGTLDVSIHSEEELRRLLSQSWLHNSLRKITLRYVRPFDGMMGYWSDSVRINLVELLNPFQKLTLVKVVGARYLEPTEAFELIRTKGLKAFKASLLREPMNFIIKFDLGGNLAHKAVRDGNLRVLKYLAKEAPWMMNEKDFVSWTPGHRAAACGDLPIVKFLSKRVQGSMREKTYEGNTAAGLALYQEKWDVLRYLIELDPGVIHIKNIDGKTVLDEARRTMAPAEVILELEAIAASTLAPAEEQK
jgi:hypothetical protein